MKGGGYETADDAVEDDADSQRDHGEVHVIEEYTSGPGIARLLNIS